MNPLHIAVVGGGAAGLMAAITAAGAGARVTVFERNEKPGRKLLMTGNGQCNFSNAHATADDYNHPAFAAPALAAFGPDRTLAFFASLGIPPRIEADGRVYPLSLQASSVLSVLLDEAKRLDIEILHGRPVVEIRREGDGFSLLVGPLGMEKASCDRVVLAAGGSAMPGTGSDGSGCRLAAALGHRITPLLPSLTKLKLDSPHLKRLDGVKVDAAVRLVGKSGVLAEERGDVLFTKYGISGPTILQLSHQANLLLSAGEEVWIAVILVTAIDREDVLRRFAALSRKRTDAALVGLVHSKLIPALLADAGIAPEILLSELSPKGLGKLMKLLFDWRFPIVGSLGFDDAQVTAGGVDIDDVDPATMESRLVPGLFLAGEVLDIDALCGGYNLQWAWSSGRLAGRSSTR
jgi:predicted Rossmann fold flavoprotein